MDQREYFILSHSELFTICYGGYLAIPKDVKFKCTFNPATCCVSFTWYFLWTLEKELQKHGLYTLQLLNSMFRDRGYIAKTEQIFYAGVGDVTETAYFYICPVATYIAPTLFVAEGAQCAKRFIGGNSIVEPKANKAKEKFNLNALEID